MKKGKIKEYNFDRGHGSIIDSETQNVVTVYANDIVHNSDKLKLLVGQAVEFNIEKNQNTMTAVNVAVIDDRVNQE